QDDIAIGTHLVTDYAVGLDSMVAYYDFPMDDVEKGIADDIQKNVRLPAAPYVVRGSESLREQIGFDMVVGNTVTAPGFYAPQGRMVRLPIRFPDLLEE